MTKPDGICDVHILMQAVATGQIKSLAEGRGIIRNSFELKEYLPQETHRWREQYEASNK